MTNTLIQFRTEEQSRQNAIRVCEQLGLDLPTYLRICIARMNQEKGIPFSMKLTQGTSGDPLAAMKQASRIAETNGISELSLEDINVEIAAARANSRKS